MKIGTFEVHQGIDMAKITLESGRTGLRPLEHQDMKARHLEMMKNRHSCEFLKLYSEPGKGL